ncbi:MAG: hypothetical protein ACJAUJ_000669 [Salibacteraceae bacterium]|jgi:hypothetical protein
MNIKYKSVILLVFLVLFNLPNWLIGQGQLPVGTPVLEDFYRRQQLLGLFDSTISFTIRPIDFKNFQTNPYQLEKSENSRKNRVVALPVISKFKFIDKQPYGGNDGTMLPVSGYQNLISAGVAGKFGPLNFQFNPEFYYAQNLAYDGFPLDAGDILWARYYRSQLNYIDTPESFGTGSIQKFYLGQSSLKLDFGPMSFGWSNQNIWWGPGVRNSLVMSNNARGFQHLTLNTNKPIKTPIGHFEGQLIAGKLEESGFDSPKSNLFYNGRFVYQPRNKDWRYLSGIAFTYQPKWIPRLSLGLTRVVQQYSETAKENKDYLPAVGNLFRKNDKFDDIVRDQLASLFLRYFWTSTKSEFYFEFARNDAAFDLRDFFLAPGHSAGYLFGFKKLFDFRGKPNEFIELGLEWTILQQSSTRIIRNASTFYIHSRVRHGYTNRGEVLGASIGPSGNSQTINVNWVSGFKKVGFQLERYVHNNDLYIDLFTDIQDFLRHWVDVSATVNASWQFDNLILNGNFGVIRSLNYQYNIFRSTGFKPGYVNVSNYSAGLDVIFLF